jgi:hypothetical protein
LRNTHAYHLFLLCSVFDRGNYIQQLPQRLIRGFTAEEVLCERDLLQKHSVQNHPETGLCNLEHAQNTISMWDSFTVYMLHTWLQIKSYTKFPINFCSSYAHITTIKYQSGGSILYNHSLMMSFKVLLLIHYHFNVP